METTDIPLLQLLHEDGTVASAELTEHDGIFRHPSLIAAAVMMDHPSAIAVLRRVLLSAAPEWRGDPGRYQAANDPHRSLETWTI